MEAIENFLGNMSALGILGVVMIYAVKVLIPRMMADFSSAMERMRELHRDEMEAQRNLFVGEIKGARKDYLESERVSREQYTNEMRSVKESLDRLADSQQQAALALHEMRNGK
ncbi:MAG: hypothetical protein ABFD89_12115 [Bryobacteraceae bacterium]